MRAQFLAASNTLVMAGHGHIATLQHVRTRALCGLIHVVIVLAHDFHPLAVCVMSTLYTLVARTYHILGPNTCDLFSWTLKRENAPRVVRGAIRLRLLGSVAAGDLTAAQVGKLRDVCDPVALCLRSAHLRSDVLLVSFEHFEVCHFGVPLGRCGRG